MIHVGLTMLINSSANPRDLRNVPRAILSAMGLGFKIEAEEALSLALFSTFSLYTPPPPPFPPHPARTILMTTSVRGGTELLEISLASSFSHLPRCLFNTDPSQTLQTPSHF